MTNKEIISAFLAGSTEGWSHSMFIEGNVLYSYSRHWPIAVRSYVGRVFINSDKYSTTTSKQTTQLTNEAKRRDCKIDFCTLEQMKGYCNAKN